ncbi:hypothetical protein Lal_00009363 [Lupinus albus]|nr:hypothetical protein Lal_00009363 [Lupinus albus]
MDMHLVLKSTLYPEMYVNLSLLPLYRALQIFNYKRSIIIDQKFHAQKIIHYKRSSRSSENLAVCPILQDCYLISRRINLVCYKVQYNLKAKNIITVALSYNEFFRFSQ